MNIITEKYINPFTDFGFKKIFGTEVNKDLLMDFLNGLIHEQGKITDIKYLNPEQLGRSESDRKAIFDIYCESETGEKFIVEMQKAKHDFFKDRSVFYATFPIREQAARGNWDYQLKAVYTVGILDFVFNETKAEKDYFHSEIKLMDTKKKTIFYDKLTFIYLEMPKFRKDADRLETHFDKWMYVLKNLPNLQERPVQLQERIFKKIFRIAEIAKLDKIELDEYEDSLKSYRDWYSVLSTAEKKGEKKGEKKEKLATAFRALEKGMSVDDVSEITGLTREQIEELLKNSRK